MSRSSFSCRFSRRSRSSSSRSFADSAASVAAGFASRRPSCWSASATGRWPCHRRGGPVTTRRDQEARPAPDLVDRSFAADEPNRLWVADITYIPTNAGFLYLAIVLDAFSRRIVGWSMTDHLRTELVLDALEMAVGQRKPREVIHHSDQGSQYTSLAFGSRCREAGVRPSMVSVGDAYDNAMAESFFSTLECELLARRRFRSRPEARMALFSYLEGFYNPVRRHSALGYRSPLVYEQEHRPQPTTETQVNQAP
ncbi:hypothetical protein MPEAHAMD_6950 [Methylobacterium frigidaeris]|uniref:Integrase catalytic domain-containing protein n=1 Tax=Methylobacterium frigidaeris TaxID=2038277 RepID=A0AA37HJ49_9HYPH|nr:IS3 family transposase [Methylobacterium frigidaeris]GJD66752.1 hypothetical protein MPEAHAMD_6950 [Methylobacterium frigidaeris]